MVKKPNRKTPANNSTNLLKKSWDKVSSYVWHSSRWRRFLSIVSIILLIFVASQYIVAQWYINKHKNEPLNLGTTFIVPYAESFGLDPKQTLSAIFSDLDIKRVRLVSYWKDIEKTPGQYDFSSLDWQFAMANEHGAKVSLAVGLRQPRWPECHEPEWVDRDRKDQWQPKLMDFMSAVINRYKDNPALVEYQLENEFFMKVFGDCWDFDRQRLVDEAKLVKRLDPNHKLIISRSDNWIGVPVGEPTPDQFAISIYKRVWDATITKRYFEYPLPYWFYAALAGTEELISGKDMIIHELQAEPWTPNGLLITQTSVSEQFKSLNPKRMHDRISYAKDTGMRTIDLWGAEWWYWLKVEKGDSSVWNIIKEEVVSAQLENSRIKK